MKQKQKNLTFSLGFRSDPYVYGSLAVFFNVWQWHKIFLKCGFEKFLRGFFEQVSGDWNFQIKHSSIKQKPETTVTKDNVLKKSSFS